ncbi:hypothetical protein BH20ACT4_BH20ACT4_09870 [soil metagenome]
MDFDCPRCHEHVTEEYFGPCGDCREALRASLARAGRRVDVAEYEPKMNVTSNAAPKAPTGRASASEPDRDGVRGRSPR